MGKVDENKKLKREALLESAYMLFTTKGFAKTSISDIVENAGVAKGTFYLYFHSKYDIRNKLIAYKSNEIFMKAEQAVGAPDNHNPEEHIVGVIDHILNQLIENPVLLKFIAKNLSFGIFKNVAAEATDDNYFYKLYQSRMQEYSEIYEEPQIMMYFVIELISSTCYGAVLYQEPVGINELKPYLLRAVRQIMEAHRLP